ncbi:hypothetical protein LSTR_LSTR004126 [Laodelphax striatellus]|uniref:DnaJ homolog subfamily C member 17 n=1 Tax=Laodelphax striatellus TaxID=195883 RepID=A0A482WGW9_LAOST|nr:hypothetical protein LSTR_LSTR004126 [Laodelphax striatellus]
MSEKFEDLDVYGILGIEQTATVEEVKKAYRKKALKCHPDKNPDNPKAAEEFQQLSRVLEILIDESARAAYDKVINSKKAAKLRHRALDSRRKKFKEDLEARERAADSRFKSSYSEKSDEEKLKDAIERLRKEGSKQLQEEIELVQKQIAEELLKSNPSVGGSSGKKIKVRWTAAKDDDKNGGYNEENLKRIFTKYGDIEVVIVSKKKKGSALVEFTQSGPASNAEKYENGFPENPLRIEMIDKVPEVSTPLPRQEPNHLSKNTSNPKSTSINTDFESLVMRQMRQAEERKRLIEQLQKEEEENN